MDRTLKLTAALVVVVVIGCAALFFTGILGGSAGVNGADDTRLSQNLTVFFFYGEECPHCHTVMPLVINLSKKYPEVEFRLLEIWHNQKNYVIYYEINAELKNSYDGIPEAIVGDTILFGERDIPNGLEAAIQDQLKKKELSDTALTGAVVSTTPSSLANVSGRTITGYFFYGNGCLHCENVKPLLRDLTAKYPALDIRELEIYHNATNQVIFASMQQQYGTGNTGIPVFFIGTRVFVGDVDIKDHLEAAILEEIRSFNSGTNASVIVTPNPAAPYPETAVITPSLVIGAALIDSINPCAFSVLVFLLISVVPIRDKRRILAVGGCYIAAVFSLYLLSGLGLFSLVRLTGVSIFLAYIGAVVAIVLGLVSVIDVMRHKGEFLLAIPASRKEQIDRYILRATLPAAFVLGILVGIFELPCTGGIYLAILGLVSSNYTLAEGLPYLILYNIIFVLPLVVILVLVAFGLNPERADAWRIRHRRALRLIVGIAMILLGVLIFSGIFG